MQDPTENDKQPLKSSGERLNFIIAICAILISAASFYATYLQADAANKQVQAMTMPMIQFGHGNNKGDNEKVINFSLKNAGMGPALLHTVSFEYQGKTYQSLFQILNACCLPAVTDFQAKSKQSDSEVPQFITSPLINTIIPGQDTYRFMELRHHPGNELIWHDLNKLRFELGFQACYCSLLGDCFMVDENTNNQAVKSCQ